MHPPIEAAICSIVVLYLLVSVVKMDCKALDSEAQHDK